MEGQEREEGGGEGRVAVYGQLDAQSDTRGGGHIGGRGV